jgi:hypothetical protein
LVEGVGFGKDGGIGWTGAAAVLGLDCYARRKKTDEWGPLVSEGKGLWLTLSG